MLSDPEFRKLLDHLNRPWAGFRKVRKGVKKRLRRHMQKLDCTTVEQYILKLAHDPHAKAACDHCLQVPISRFFRDRALWQTLEAKILPDVAHRFSHSLRIWSAGCACGEEAYSLAIACNELRLASALELLATDADDVCLARARSGTFGRSSLKEVPHELRERYFQSKKKGRHYLIRFQLLPPIRWHQHDLRDAPPDNGPFHMILLRNNLLTYYRGPELRAAFAQIVATLAPGGYLVIGSHERLPIPDCTLIREKGCPWVYRREDRVPSRNLKTDKRAAGCNHCQK